MLQLREEDVSRVWADVIGIPDADVDTNFFDLGGHSLLLMELVNQLNQKLGIDADILVLMEYPTVAKFIAYWNTAVAPVEGGR